MRYFRTDFRKYLDNLGNSSENIEMKRQYTPYLEQYLKKKLIFMTGPRQCGKTTLSMMLEDQYEYLNFDNDEHRQIILEKSWDRRKHLIIFDEIHKKPFWKRWLKGVYDVEGLNPPIVITGSAKLDTYRKVGDSLAGRYFQYQIHPLDIRELARTGENISHEEVLERILKFGGFPEPFLENDEKFYNLWRRSHTDIILKQDLIELEHVSDIKSVELLLDLLRNRVGSPLSFSSLARDLERSDKTIKKWLTMLENLYLVFKITPYSKNIGRSNLKQPKFYFFDCGHVLGDEGIRLENVVACSLLKECHFRNDCLGEDWNLHYLSKQGAQEIDFLITKDRQPHIMIEVKLSDDSPSKNFSIFKHDLPNIKKVQLVKNIQREKTFPDGTEIREVSNWLARW